MSLSDFTSMFEVAVALNFTFVAVEYANSYTNMLAKHVYKLHEKIKLLFVDLKNTVNKESIYSLKGNNVDGINTITKVQELQRDYTTLQKDTENEKKMLLDEVNEKCHFKSFAFVSLYLALYSISALMFAGFDDDKYFLTDLFWAIFSVLSVIFVLIYTALVKCNIWQKYTMSLLVSIYSFLIILLFSWILTSFIFNDNFYSLPFWIKCSYWIPPITALFPFANFIIFTLIMKRRAALLYEKSRNKINELQKRWNDIKEKAGKLAAVNEVASDMNDNQLSLSVNDIKEILLHATPNFKVVSNKQTTISNNNDSALAKKGRGSRNSKSKYKREKDNGTK